MSIQPLAFGSDLDEYLLASSDLMVDYATAEIRAYCGWHIAPSLEQTFAKVGTGTTRLDIPTLRLTAVAVVLQDGVADLSDITFTDVGTITNPSVWTGEIVSVTVTHGYETVPYDLRAVVLALAARAQSSVDGGFVRQVGQVAYQVPKSDGGLTLLDSEKETLARYRLPVIA